ncbi:MAG: hypothetical protein ACP5RV_04170 [Thiomonas sp.]
MNKLFDPLPTAPDLTDLAPSDTHPRPRPHGPPCVEARAWA